MNRDIHLRLEPTGRKIVAAADTPLQDVLLEHEVEFPCGGRGTCGKCRVRVLEGRLDPGPEDVLELGQAAVDAGWRLACCGHATHEVTLQLAQWETQVLTDETPIEVTPRDGWGVAIDLGTTTIAGQLVDLRTGNVLAVRSGLNPQARYGADVMSRVRYAVTDSGDLQLTAMIRQYLEAMISELVQEAALSDIAQQPLCEVVIVGNTVMHHLFCGCDVSPLARCPFDSPLLGAQSFTVSQLDWDFPSSPLVRFLPCLGGFIGSDVLAGIVAAQMDKSSELQVLIDLGTNGEIVVTKADRMICAATAAGPAFEGARIQMGMRAACGAIDRVTIVQHDQRRELQCHVIGNQTPSGICGSGLIDATACALELGQLAPSGRLVDKSDRYALASPVSIHQCDFRELQLAKGAIAAGIELLLTRLGGSVEAVSRVFLCGAFGNYLDVRNARRLGLLPFPADQVTAMGNTALLGAKLALLTHENFASREADICQRIEHFGFNEDPDFMDVYVRHMTFPAVNSEEMSPM